MPKISATQEAEAENWLNQRVEGCSEERSCHCIPAWLQSEREERNKERERERQREKERKKDLYP